MKGFRTIAVNVLAAIIPIMEMTELTDVLPPEWLPFYTLAVVLANMALRLITTTPVGKAS